MIVGAYLIGSVSFGYLIGRLRGVDLRTQGSHNIGATNAARVLGWPWGVSVFVLDCLKGYLPMLWYLRHLGGNAEHLGTWDMGRLLLAMWALVLGHTFTCFLGFRGGKGVATMAGCLTAVLPQVAGWAILAWLIVVSATRYVSLASMSAGVVMVLTAVLKYVKTDEVLRPAEWMLPGMLGLILILVVVRHRENVIRLCRGTEPKIFSKKNT